MALSRAIRRAGIPDFRLHDLRHCFASYAAMEGVSQKALMSLLGHKDARMTHRYTHLSEDYLRQVVDGLSLGKSPGLMGKENQGA